MKLKILLILYIVLTLAFIALSEIRQSRSISQIESVLNKVYFEAE